MRRSLPFASAFLLAGSALAQTPAQSTVMTPCNAPAPPGSLVPAPLGDGIWAQAPAGLSVVEIESVQAAWPWVEETVLDGYLGDSYYRWDGWFYSSSPPSYPALEYRFEVQVAGEYLLRLRNRHDHPESGEENDCWLKVNDLPWDKAYNNFGESSVGVWNWKVQLGSTGQEPRYFLNPGVHTVKIKGRSPGFKIDRIHLHLVGFPGAQSTYLQESPLAVSRPVIGQTLDVQIDDPTNFAQLTPGATWGALVTELPDTNSPCGTPVVGFGAFGGVGEALVRLDGPQLVGGIQPWDGPGSPSEVSVPVPNDPTLVGLVVLTQAALVDTSPGAVSLLVLTDGLELRIGDG